MSILWAEFDIGLLTDSMEWGTATVLARVVVRRCPSTGPPISIRRIYDTSGNAEYHGRTMVQQWTVVQ